MLGLMIAVGVAVSPIAAASGNVEGSGGANTTVDSDGTQGSLAPAVQGVTDDDGYQDALLIGSEEAVPQYKAGSK